jgi:(S)-citramalyl-CoA lyase
MNRTGDRVRSLLFLPATRPDRLERALATGADRVCLDLEDGVAAGAKAGARAALVSILQTDAVPPGLGVRINSPRTEDGLRDVLALCELPPRPIAVMLPKVESAEEVRWIEALLATRHPEVRLQLLIETARAIEAASALAAASARTELVMFGGIDLAADLGAELAWEPLLYGRARVIGAAAAAGVGALDSVMLDIDAPDALRQEAERARRMGYTGKAAIHPRQLAPIHEAFAPTPDEVARARRIVAVYEESASGVAVLDGRLVDLPVVRGARRLLERAALPEEPAK